MSAAQPSHSFAFERRFERIPDRRRDGVTLRRSAVIGAGIGVFALSAWAGIATLCALQTDVLSVAFLARHTAAERAYEERIGALRARLERVTSQKLVEQEGTDARLAQIADRQRELEKRHAALARLLDQAGNSAVSRARKTREASASPELGPRTSAPPSTKPAPLTDAFELRTGDSRSAPAIESLLPLHQSGSMTA
jgi:hypothetical protein